MSAHVFKLSLLKVFALLNTSEGSYSVSLTLLSFGHYLKACVIGQIIAYIHVIVYSKWVQVIIWTADCKLLLELNYLYGSHAIRICPTVYVTNTTWGIKGRVNLLGSSRNWSTSVLHFCYLCQSLPFVWTLVAVRGKSVINGSLSWPLEETLFFLLTSWQRVIPSWVVTKGLSRNCLRSQSPASAVFSYLLLSHFLDCTV